MAEKLTQEYLPGMAPKKNQIVHNAGLRYIKARDERIELSRDEKKAKDNLLAKMKEQGLSDYNYGNLSVHVDTDESVKAKLASHDPENVEKEK